MSVWKIALGRQLLIAVTTGGAALLPFVVYAQSHETPIVPPAPAPEDGRIVSHDLHPSIDQPVPSSHYSAPTQSVAVPYCPAPQYSNQQCRHDQKERCRLCDPNASLNAMSRVLQVGTSLHGIMATQIAKGDAAQMVLYEYDFHPSEARLNCHGMMRLLQIARKLPRVPFPLLIQPSLVDPALDQARRQVVVDTLLSLEPSMSVERVIIALPPARGLDGIDAELIHARVLRLSAGGAPGSGVLAAPTAAAAVPPAR